MINRAGLYNSLGSLIFSYMIFTLPFTVWVLTSFMRALPKDLEEAAYIDGASTMQVFYRVMLPLLARRSSRQGSSPSSRPGTSSSSRCRSRRRGEAGGAVAIVKHDWRVGKRLSDPWGQIMAATVIVTLPLIVMTLVLQRRILAGLTAGAVKG